MSVVRVRAPATHREPRPGFDCAAVALDLWNELEVTEGDGEADLDHLGVPGVRAPRAASRDDASRSSTASRASAGSARARR